MDDAISGGTICLYYEMTGGLSGKKSVGLSAGGSNSVNH